MRWLDVCHVCCVVMCGCVCVLVVCAVLLFSRFLGVGRGGGVVVGCGLFFGGGGGGGRERRGVSVVRRGGPIRESGESLGQRAIRASVDRRARGRESGAIALVPRSLFR